MRQALHSHRVRSVFPELAITSAARPGARVCLQVCLFWQYQLSDTVWRCMKMPRRQRKRRLVICFLTAVGHKRLSCLEMTSRQSLGHCLDVLSCLFLFFLKILDHDKRSNLGLLVMQIILGRKSLETVS
jgi:hypothetical protein